jgi:hypothetical protein
MTTGEFIAKNKDYLAKAKLLEVLGSYEPWIKNIGHVTIMSKIRNNTLCEHSMACGHVRCHASGIVEGNALLK